MQNLNFLVPHVLGGFWSWRVEITDFFCTLLFVPSTINLRTFEMKYYLVGILPLHIH